MTLSTYPGNTAGTAGESADLLAESLSDSSDEAATGLPLVRTWRAVYILVAGIFALWVVLLTLLQWVFE